MNVVYGVGLATLAPAITIPTPAFSASLDFDFSYTNIPPVQTEPQVITPLVAENNVVTTLLGEPFAISPDTAVSAVVDWTTLSHSNVTSCTRVFLQTPLGFNWTLKAIGSPPANPYGVLNIYKNANGGPGQYRIGVEEVVSGPCKGQATMSGATMTVTDATPTGSWTANARVSLWDGTRAYVIKNYGAPDAAPYDVKSIYDAVGPGTYTVRLDENGGGGEARLSGETLTAVAIDCDTGCGVVSTPAPPVADGDVGSPVNLSLLLALGALHAAPLPRSLARHRGQAGELHPGPVVRRQLGFGFDSGARPRTGALRLPSPSRANGASANPREERRATQAEKWHFTHGIRAKNVDVTAGDSVQTIATRRAPAANWRSPPLRC